MGGGSAQAAEQNQEQGNPEKATAQSIGDENEDSNGQQATEDDTSQSAKETTSEQPNVEKIIAKMLMIIKQAYIMKIIKTLNYKIQKLKNKIQHKIQNKRSLLKNKVKRNKLLNKMQLKIQLSLQMNKWNLVRIHK